MRNPNIPYQETTKIAFIILLCLMSSIEQNLQYISVKVIDALTKYYTFLDGVEACAMNKIFYLVHILW